VFGALKLATEDHWVHFTAQAAMLAQY